jgi:hypothetical protein
MSHKASILNLKTDLQEEINLTEWISSDNFTNQTDTNKNKQSIKYIKTLRDDFLSILNDVTIQEDQDFCISLFFIRLKSEWTLINTRYTYQIQNDTLDQSLLFRAGLISALMGKVESHLSGDVAAHLNDVLTDPSGTASEKEIAQRQYNALLDAQDSLEGFQKKTEKAERDRLMVQEQLDALARTCGILDGKMLLTEQRRQHERIELLTQERDHARETEARLKALLGVTRIEDIESELTRLRESVASLTTQLMARPEPGVAPAVAPAAPEPEPVDLESMLAGLEQALKAIDS